jgi:hypothetical protein
MAVNENQVAILKGKVAAFRDEVESLIAFHEAWRPMVADAALRQRMGNSYATHTFEIIRIALRREVMMGLTRLWDNNRWAVSLKNIGNCLRDKRVVEALVMESVNNWGRLSSDDAPPSLAEPNIGTIKPEREWIKGSMAGTLQPQIDRALAIIDKYQDGGSGFATRKHLEGLRDKWLAHREVKSGVPAALDRTDEEIEAYYQDMLALVEALTHAVDKAAYDPSETADVRKTYARYFWNGVRSERMEGHPDYRGE